MCLYATFHDLIPSYNSSIMNDRSFGHIFVEEGQMIMTRLTSVMIMYTLVLCEHYFEHPWGYSSANSSGVPGTTHLLTAVEPLELLICWQQWGPWSYSSAHSSGVPGATHLLVAVASWGYSSADSGGVPGTTHLLMAVGSLELLVCWQQWGPWSYSSADSSVVPGATRLLTAVGSLELLICWQ